MIIRPRESQVNPLKGIEFTRTLTRSASPAKMGNFVEYNYKGLPFKGLAKTLYPMSQVLILARMRLRESPVDCQKEWGLHGH